MPVGTNIVVREGLKGKHAKRGGMTGIVLGHDSTESTDARRVSYEVQVYGPGEGMPRTFTHDQLLQKAYCILGGLVARPELNGIAGCVQGYVAEKGRYNVAIEGGTWVQLKPLNLRFKKDTRLIITGYTDAKYNGRIGKVKVYDENSGLYVVEVFEDEELEVRKNLKLAPENLVL